MQAIMVSKLMSLGRPNSLFTVLRNWMAEKTAGAHESGDKNGKLISSVDAF